MTYARRLEADRVHATTRRTARRCFFLQPTPEVTGIMAYGFGRALQKNPRVKVLALTIHVNHVHGAFHDVPGLGPDGEEVSQLPSMLGHAHSLTARALNTHYGRGEALWRDGSYGNVEIHDELSLEDQIEYANLQVVKDGLVPHPDLWPGFMIRPKDFGTTITVELPEGAFFGGRRPSWVKPTHPDALAEWEEELAQAERDALDVARARAREADRKKGRTSKRRRQLEESRERRRKRALARREQRRERPRRSRSTLPKTVTFEVGVPPGWEGRVEEARAHFTKRIDDGAKEIQEIFAAQGREFMGVEAVLAQDPRESAGDTWPNFGLNPRIACKDRDLRIEALLGLRAWRADMREKQRAWAKGNRNVVFPRGAYGMRRFHAARVASARAPGANAPT